MLSSLEKAYENERYALRWHQVLTVLLCLGMVILVTPEGRAQSLPLPSWNEGPAKREIIAFVSAVTSPLNPDFVPESERIAVFDLDGTLWVEQPVYPEVSFAYDMLTERASIDPAFARSEPYHSILARGRSALNRLDRADLDALLSLAMSGMTVDALKAEARAWLETARQACWNEPHNRLAYQPMLEVMSYFQANGFRNYVVTGSGQDFARSFGHEVLGLPPAQVVGTARLSSLVYDKSGKPQLVNRPEVMLEVAGLGKPEAIQLFIGLQPVAAFGNSGGDADMLEYVSSRDGRSLAMLVLHDDRVREYAYGPAVGLPDTGIGVFDQALYDRAMRSGWHVISMQNEWREILPGLRKSTSLSPTEACAMPPRQ